MSEGNVRGNEGKGVTKNQVEVKGNEEKESRGSERNFGEEK